MLAFFEFFNKLLWIVGSALAHPGKPSQFDPTSTKLSSRVLLTGYGILTSMVIVASGLAGQAIAQSPATGIGVALLFWFGVTTVGTVAPNDRRPVTTHVTVGRGYTIALFIVAFLTIASFAGWAIVETVSFQMPMDRADFAAKLYDFAKSGFFLFMGLVGGKAAK